MSRSLSRLVVLVAALAWSAACGGPAVATPAPAGVPTASPTAVSASEPARTAATQPASALVPRVHDGGGVTVQVTPRAPAPGGALAFGIVMDTHLVELNDDLLKAAVLRDDAGALYMPQAWDGEGPGGHHRSGVLTFDALPRSPKALTLVLKGVGGVPERTFEWKLAQ